MDIKSTGFYTDTSAFKTNQLDKAQKSNDQFADLLMNAMSNTATVANSQVTDVTQVQAAEKVAKTDSGIQVSQSIPNKLPDRVEEKIEQLENNPDKNAAMQEVQQIADSLMMTFYQIDFTLPMDHPDFARYSISGERVSQALQERNNDLTDQLQQETSRIYAEGVRKGESAAEIYRNIEQYKADNLPHDFLLNSGWYGTA